MDKFQSNLSFDNLFNTSGFEVNRAAIEPNCSKIDDVGEVLVGARKHLWVAFSKVVGKDYTIEGEEYSRSEFPTLNYEKLLKDGACPVKLAAIAAAYSGIPVKRVVPHLRKAWNKHFAAIMVFVQQLLTDENLNPLQIRRISALSGSFKGISSRIELGMELGFPAVLSMKECSVEFANAPVPPYFYVRNTKGNANFDDKFANRADAVSFLRDLIMDTVKTDENLKAMTKKKGRVYKVCVYSRTDSLGDYFLGWKGCLAEPVILADGFESVHKARLYATEHHDELQQKLISMKVEKRFWLEDDTGRIGPNWTDGQVTAEDVLSVCKLRGLQYGHWVTQSERYTSNQMAFDGLHDLANLIGMPVSFVGFNGDLGLAFGARGTAKGVTSAAAHFEPISFNINLTRLKGYGSAAHEWFHAFDSFLGAVLRTGQQKHRSISVYATECVEMRDMGHLTIEMQNALGGLVETLLKTGVRKRSLVLDALRSKPYWTTIVEMAARAFESWIFHELELSGMKNGWLVSVDYSMEDESDWPYPTRHEMKEGLADAFRDLFKVYRQYAGNAAL